MESGADMKLIVTFIIWCLPSNCHGSKKKVDRWMKKGGLVGLYDEPYAEEAIRRLLHA